MSPVRDGRAGWELVALGHSDAVVRRSPDGAAFAKTARTPLAAAELVAERDRLSWAAAAGVPSPVVVDWLDGRAPTLVTTAVPGVPLSSLRRARGARAVTALADAIACLHAIDAASCPFDRTLVVTVAAARAHVSAGVVDESDFDDERLGRTAADLLADADAQLAEMTQGEAHDLVVCHGDACLPNVMVDPATMQWTGVVDVGRLGVADRHWDLALASRSIGDQVLNPAFGPVLASRLLADVRWSARVDTDRLAFYRLLDELF